MRHNIEVVRSELTLSKDELALYMTRAAGMTSIVDTSSLELQQTSRLPGLTYLINAQLDGCRPIDNVKPRASAFANQAGKSMLRLPPHHLRQRPSDL